MKGKNQLIVELRGTLDELADTVAKRERCTWRHQANLEDHVRWHKEEWERLCTIFEAELVACGMPPLKPIFALPSTSDYQPWQGLKGPRQEA